MLCCNRIYYSLVLVRNFVKSVTIKTKSVNDFTANVFVNYKVYLLAPLLYQVPDTNKLSKQLSNSILLLFHSLSPSSSAKDTTCLPSISVVNISAVNASVLSPEI